MALADKMKHLAERVQDVPRQLEAAVDAQLVRLDTVESRGSDAMSRFRSYIDDVHQSVGAVEDVLNRLTNSPPRT